MKYSLPWGLLPAEARVGQSFDESIRLFRGDKIARLAEAQHVGILSTALAAGDLESIYRFGINAESQNTWGQAILTAKGHISMSEQHAGRTTPFISASPRRSFAERFAQDADCGVVEVEVPASRLIAPFMDSRPGYIPNEVLIVGGVLAEEIVALHSVSGDTQ